MPLFFTSGPLVRIILCLFLHPLLLEAGEAVGRGTKSDKIALKLRSGKIETLEEASRMLVDISLGDFNLKAVMAFFRRFMLLNMGNSQATLIAIVAASIEEASAAVPVAKHACNTYVNVL